MEEEKGDRFLFFFKDGLHFISFEFFSYFISHLSFISSLFKHFKYLTLAEITDSAGNIINRESEEI